MSKRTSKWVAPAMATTTFVKSRRRRCVNLLTVSLSAKPRVVPTATVWTTSCGGNNRRAASSNLGSKRIDR